MVKAFTSTLISWQKYSVYCFIHNIREIALLDIKSLCEQLDLSETLARVWSTGGLLMHVQLMTAIPIRSGSLIMISNVKSTTKLWNSEQSLVTVRDNFTTNEAGPLIACLPLHWLQWHKQLLFWRHAPQCESNLTWTNQLVGIRRHRI